jgi:hypothetical protein
MPILFSSVFIFGRSQYLVFCSVEFKDSEGSCHSLLVLLSGQVSEPVVTVIKSLLEKLMSRLKFQSRSPYRTLRLDYRSHYLKAKS